MAFIHVVIAPNWHFFNSLKSSSRRWCTYGTGFDPRDTLKKYRELFSSHNVGIDPKSVQTDCSNVQQVVLPENHGFSAGAFSGRPGRYLEPQPDRHTGEKFHKFLKFWKQVLLFAPIWSTNINVFIRIYAAANRLSGWLWSSQKWRWKRRWRWFPETDKSSRSFKQHCNGHFSAGRSAHLRHNHSLQ